MSSSASVTYRLVLPSRRRATAATIVASRTTIRRGGSSTLTGRLVDAANGRAVIGMKVSIYYRRLGARSWSVLTSRITGRTGTFTLSVRPSRTTYYLAVSWLTRTWASDQSSARRINVS